MRCSGCCFEGTLTHIEALAEIAVATGCTMRYRVGGVEGKITPSGKGKRAKSAAPPSPSAAASPAAAGDAAAWFELVDRFAAHQGDRRNLRATYVTSTRRRLAAFGRPFGEWSAIETIADFTAARADAYIAWKLSGSRPITSKSANEMTTSLRAFGSWARRQRLLPVDPMADLERVADDRDARPRHASRALTADEVWRLVCVAAASEIADGRRRNKHVALQYLLIATTGLRISEVARGSPNGNPNGGLRWGDVDLRARRIRIRPEVAKIRNVAFVPVHAVLAGALRERKRKAGRVTSDAYVTGCAVDSQTFRRDLERARIPRLTRGGPASTTSLRKFYCTAMDELVERGVITERVRNELTRHRARRNIAEKHYIETGHVWKAMVRGMAHLHVGSATFAETQTSNVDFADEPAHGAAIRGYAEGSMTENLHMIDGPGTQDGVVGPASNTPGGVQGADFEAMRMRGLEPLGAVECGAKLDKKTGYGESPQRYSDAPAADQHAALIAALRTAVHAFAAVLDAASPGTARPEKIRPEKAGLEKAGPDGTGSDGTGSDRETRNGQRHTGGGSGATGPGRGRPRLAPA